MKDFLPLIIVNGLLIIPCIVIHLIINYKNDKHYLCNLILGKNKRIDYTSFDLNGRKNYTVMQLYDSWTYNFQMPYIHNKKIIESHNYYVTLFKYIIINLL